MAEAYNHSWRPCPFLPARLYRVRVDFTSCDSLARVNDFRAGETFAFVRCDWSRYYELGVYVFADTAGCERGWTVKDAESLDGWHNLFTGWMTCCRMLLASSERP